MISNEVREAVWALYENEHLSKAEIGRRLGISRNKVIETLKHEKYRNAHLINSMKEIKKEQTESLIEMMSKDTRLSSITNKILDIMNDDEQLQNEINRNGLRPLATVLGILSDKTIRIAELNKKSDTQDKAVNVTIVNDADKIAKVYSDEKDITDGTNIN